MNDTIDRRQDSQKTLLIEQLRRTPIIQVACEKTGVARATYYRWRKDDAEFSKACDEALADGVELVSDLAESKLISGIKSQNHSAISFWLRHRHPAYAQKLQIQAKVETDGTLTPEQQELVRRALNQIAGPNNPASEPYDPEGE